MTTPEIHGLSSREVGERVAAGRINNVPDAPVRSLSEIIRANVFTPVNGIISVFFVLILVAGFPADALFAGVVVSNSVIGVVQELRARATLNRLAVLNAPKAFALRDGIVNEISVSEVVADEVLALQPGEQVVVDGEVLEAIGLEVDESLLTGEADAVEKALGDKVLSGSFVSAGSGLFRATAIGPEAYASKLAEEARLFKLADSELRSGVNTILRWLTFIIPPAAALLFLRLINDDADPWQVDLQGTVAAAVAMVPDGLVLLTSLAFIVGVISLARRQALAKELASVELLARVDTLCLDKTGTITTGAISFGDIEPLGDTDRSHLEAALGAIAATDPNPNATLAAVSGRFARPDGWELAEATPFSSARKWAGAAFVDRGSFYLGAPEILLDGEDAATTEAIARQTEEGRRVLLLAHSPDRYTGDALVSHRQPLGLVLLEDTVRDDANEILNYFLKQGVTLKVISGDHPETVAAVARRAGVPHAEQGTDARSLPSDADELAEVVDNTTVFGRVTPHQKRAMVAALQSRGHVVAMTGDGVNDVLALKDADMGIAMGSGSSSTRAVAQLVLLDNKFSTLPQVLTEGRKVINNIERVANLFITKATYALVLTAIAGVIGSPFPFLPRQLTLIGTFSIGVPGFFLALAPNAELVRPGFLHRTLSFSLPSGLAAGIAAAGVYEYLRRDSGFTLAEARTGATITLLAIGLIILLAISRPLRPWKLVLAGFMAACYVLIVSWDWARTYFEMDLPGTEATVPILTATGIAGAVIAVVAVLVEHNKNKHKH